MDRRILSIAGGLAAVGLLVALFVMRERDLLTQIIVAVLLAADLVGLYFIMQYGLSHDGLPHVDTAENSSAVQKLRQMNATRLAKVEAGRARAALTAGSAEAAPAEAAPKRAPSRRAKADAAPAAE